MHACKPRLLIIQLSINTSFPTHVNHIPTEQKSTSTLSIALLVLVGEQWWLHIPAD